MDGRAPHVRGPRRRRGSAAHDQTSPRVAFDGTSYLVVWEDQRTAVNAYDVYGARVAKDGTVLDPAGIPICTAAGNQQAPDVASDGTLSLVVWSDARSSTPYI